MKPMGEKIKCFYALPSLMLMLMMSFSIVSLVTSFNGQMPYCGRVYASGDGVPIVNAMVVASGAEGYGYVNTGVDGNYEINKGLKTGTYDVHVTAFGYIDTDVSDVSITAELTTPLNFFLNWSGGISGTVRNSEGALLQGIAVMAFSEDGEYFSYATTNTDGTYVMATNLETGTYNVTVPFPRGLVSNMTTGISVTRGVETKDVDITLFPSGTITGRITGENDVPVANASVMAMCLDTPEYMGFVCATDSNGSYTMNSGLGTGNYMVRASKGAAQGFYGGSLPANVTVVAGETTSNIDITIVMLSPSPTGSISGKVTDADGRPIEGATMSASGTGSGIATADENGNYTIYGLPAGTYTVEASANGFQTQNRTDVEVVAYQDTPNINLQLDPLPPEQSGTLTGAVTGEANPIPEFNMWTTPFLLLGTVTAIILLRIFKDRKRKLQ